MGGNKGKTSTSYKAVLGAGEEGTFNPTREDVMQQEPLSREDIERVKSIEEEALEYASSSQSVRDFLRAELLAQNIHYTQSYEVFEHMNNSPEAGKMTNVFLQTANTLFSEVDKVLGPHPYRHMLLQTYMQDEKSPGTTGTFSRFSDGERNLTFFLKTVQELKSISFNPLVSRCSTTGYGTVATTTHEFGHYLQFRLIDAGVSLKPIFTSGRGIENYEAVSYYGAKNFKECFAESFSAYVMGIKPVQGKEYFKEFKAAMQSAGFGHLEGKFKPKATTLTTPKVMSAPRVLKRNSLPTTSVNGNTVTVKIGSTSVEVAFSPNMLERGFSVRKILGVRYKIYPDGRIEEHRL